MNGEKGKGEQSKRERVGRSNVERLWVRKRHRLRGGWKRIR